MLTGSKGGGKRHVYEKASISTQNPAGVTKVGLTFLAKQWEASSQLI
jgi:hypothetical protein